MIGFLSKSQIVFQIPLECIQRIYLVFGYYIKPFYGCIKVSLSFTQNCSIFLRFVFPKPIECEFAVALPPELQPLGNNYARDEFRRHKNCNETEAKIFMVEWTNYAVQLSQQLGLGVRGKPKREIGANLNVEDLDKFKEDQIVQLYELMKAATEDVDTTTISSTSIHTDGDKANKS